MQNPTIVVITDRNDLDGKYKYPPDSTEGRCH